MSITLTPTIVDVDGRLLEAYERETQASPEKLTELKLDNGEAVLANIGVAQIPEFIVLQASEISKNQTVTWTLANLGQTLLLKSLYIDAPNADQLDFEILQDGHKIFDFFVRRSQTPYQFPPNPLPPNLQIRIVAKSPINFIRIALTPAIILETILPDARPAD